MSIIGKQIDRYRILEQLGQGGMAVVYKAYDTRLERDVAVKLIRKKAIPEEQHEKLLARFEREAKAQAKFSHPNIVPIFDYGEYAGSPYLVQELVEGGTLKDLTGKPMDYQEAAALLAPIADAIAYAHEQGIIHRDLKPSNILIGKRPMLTDFGIAKILETEEATLTGTGLGVGTPEYMAPEQWRGKPVFQTDIYALGVIFYELLTGHKPYTAETPAAVAIKQVTEPLLLPNDVLDSLPEEVEKVLYKALAIHPEDRYESMADFEKILKQLTEDQKLPPIIQSQTEEKPVSTQEEKYLEINLLDLDEQETIDTLDTQSEINQNSKKELRIEETNPVEPEIKTSNVSTEEKKKREATSWIWILGIGILLILFSEIFHRYDLNKDLDTYVIKTQTRKIDGMEMVYVPAGEFKMGSNDGDSDEQPIHSVYLGAYWIDKFEVTNQQYAVFLNEMGNQIEGGVEWLDDYARIEKDNGAWQADKGYEDHPVVYVSWYGAQAYCEWIGGSLPTEAQWEKATRGTDERTYPWGNQIPTNNLVNYKRNQGGTTEVGSYPEGMSPYGAMDMAGNV